MCELTAQGYPSPEWFAVNQPIEDFLDSEWQPHVDRLLPNYDVANTNPKWIGEGTSLDITRLLGTEGRYNSRNTVLSVGGGNGAEPLTILRQAPYVYILDPTVGEVTQPIYPHRAIKGYAEDMPFKDKSFWWVISNKAVGWYPKVINPYWAIREMIRVAQERVNITIGQDEENKLLLETTIEKIKDSPEGKRIRKMNITDTEIAFLLNP